MPPIPETPFQPSARSQIWGVIIGALQTDPILKSAVNLWQVWSGELEDTTEPTEANMPLVRITPAGGSQRWLDENAQECTLNLKIELGILGLVITDMFDFWSQIEVALFTGNAVLQGIYAYGGISKTITEPAITPRMFGDKAGLSATGILQVKMRINS